LGIKKEVIHGKEKKSKEKGYKEKDSKEEEEIRV